jgi:hypothetical protein
LSEFVEDLEAGSTESVKMVVIVNVSLPAALDALAGYVRPRSFCRCTYARYAESKSNANEFKIISRS